jgi:DNA-binding transcriptional LysR family regulator
MASAHGQLTIVPLLGEFVARYPDISVDIDLSDQLAHVLGGRMDIAVRFESLPNSPLTARRRRDRPNRRSVVSRLSRAPYYSHPAEGSAQGSMLEPLRDEDLDVCPACGSPPETLDHYLPKGRYPQFVITPVNLTPMCDPCHRRKKEKTGNAVSPRFFIHPYFDAFSLPQIL